MIGLMESPSSLIMCSNHLLPSESSGSRTYKPLNATTHLSGAAAASDSPGCSAAADEPAPLEKVVAVATLDVARSTPPLTAITLNENVCAGKRSEERRVGKEC